MAPICLLSNSIGETQEDWLAHEAVGCFGAVDRASAGVVTADRPVCWRAVWVFPAYSGYEDSQR